MQKVHFSFIKDLKNAEFYDLFYTIVEIFDSAKIENEIIKAISRPLKSHLKPLLKLKASNTSHPLTAVINNKLKTRTEFLSAMRLAIDSRLLWHIPEVRVAANTLKQWLERYKKDLYRPTLSAQSNSVRCVIDDRSKDKEIQKAITLLQLDELLDEVLKLTEEIMQGCTQRNHMIVTHQKATSGRRKKAKKDLELAMNTIMIFHSISNNNEEKEKLMELNDEIDNYINTFRIKLLSRRTKSKNKRELKVAVEELIDTTKKPEPTNNNLPMVIYDGLKINSECKPSTLNLTKQATVEKRPTQKSIEKDELKDKRAITKNGLNNSTSKMGNKKGFDGGSVPRTT